MLWQGIRGETLPDMAPATKIYLTILYFDHPNERDMLGRRNPDSPNILMLNQWKFQHNPEFEKNPIFCRFNGESYLIYFIKNFVQIMKN